MIRVLACSSIALILLILAACSTGKHAPTAYYSVPVDNKAVQNEQQLSWWAYRYRIAWPEENEKPDFAVDLLLAHALVRPVLMKSSDKLLWWRFHRRASRQPPGHQFSFLFYSDRETATNVIKMLDGSNLLGRLKDSGMVQETVSSDIYKRQNSAIEAYSDSAWTPVIQRTWPSYIMGVSAYWLALIDELKIEQTDPQDAAVIDTVELSNMLEDYRRIDDEITLLWQKEGQHVLLHHLSAVFGYKPMTLRKDVVY